MPKLLFVVHRAAPFIGGSEYFVQNMAEEMNRRPGYQVTILAHEHKGDYNGIKMTNDYNCLLQKWDLIIIHGADVISQNIAHVNAALIKSPTLYMLIKPSASQVALHGMKHHTYLGYSTRHDIKHIYHNSPISNLNERYDLSWFQKSRRVRHGIVPEQAINRNVPGFFRQSLNIKTKRMIVSAGGFYPHKGMQELKDIFANLDLPDTTLCLLGYGMQENAPRWSDKVKVLFNFDYQTVISAIAEADLYVMNSTEEGFGLVLLEAMINKTQWMARDVGAAKELGFGRTYTNADSLKFLLNEFSLYAENTFPNERVIDKSGAYEYVMVNHTIVQTCNDIEDILRERQ